MWHRGIQCTEPALNWDEFAGFNQARKNGAHINGYIGHDEPATLFYSNRPGSGNNVTYQMVLPKDPPTRPKQDGSGGTDSFQLHPTFWLGMVMCDDQGSPNPDELLHRPSQCPVQAGQRQQHLQQPESVQSALLRPRPGPGLRGDAVLPAGLGAVAGLASAARPTSGAPR